MLAIFFVVNYFENLSYKIRWFRLIVVICISLLLPAPNIFLNQKYLIYFGPIPNISNEKEHKARIDLKEPRLWSGSTISYLARLFGQEVKSPDIQVCLTNDSDPNPAGLDESDPRLDNESGALSIMVKNVDTLETKNIYAETGKMKCEIFRGGRIEVTDVLEFRSLQIVNKDGNGKDLVTIFFNPRNSIVETRVLFEWYEYFFQVFLCLLSIGFLIEIGGTLTRFLIRKK